MVTMLKVIQQRPFQVFYRCYSSTTISHPISGNQTLTISGKTYVTDDWTNVSEKILSKMNKNLHNRDGHPLNLIKRRIQKFFYKAFTNSRGNPIFSIYDNLSPVVTVEQNYESLLVPKDHPSRNKSNCYYVNSEILLRAHTSAHQQDLIRSGLDAFLVVGDTYRRDSIDSSHYPVFHQVEGVRLFTRTDLFKDVSNSLDFCLFENGKKEAEKQAWHTMEAAKILEHNLKSSLLEMVLNLFGRDIETQWIETYFPFTHPSWELEIKIQDKWMEVLGCGIMEQEILHSAGAGHKIGWAFGLGLERLAMKLYDIPDIRLFWSEDSGFLSQFNVHDPETNIKYKPISQFPQCINDLSFWLPESYQENDFYELVRNVGGDLVEQVYLIDEFFHPKEQRQSHCYRIVYRHMEQTLLQSEVNDVHQLIEAAVVNQLGGDIR